MAKYKSETISDTIHYRNLVANIDVVKQPSFTFKVDKKFKALYDILNAEFVTSPDDEIAENLADKKIHIEVKETENSIVVEFINHHNELINSVNFELIYCDDKFSYGRCKNTSSENKYMLKQFDRISIVYSIRKIIKELQPYGK